MKTTLAFAALLLTAGCGSSVVTVANSSENAGVAELVGSPCVPGASKADFTSFAKTVEVRRLGSSLFSKFTDEEIAAADRLVKDGKLESIELKYLLTDSNVAEYRYTKCY